MSDPRQQGKVRLTAAEPGATEKPVQKQVAATSFVRPADGGRVTLAVETFLDFSPGVALDDLEAALNTTGFEGVDDAASVRLACASPTSEPSAPPAEFAAPILKRVLEVKPPPTPISVYEPIEFLDYDDEEDLTGLDGGIEAEPEPEPDPPVLSELLAVELPKAVALGVAKMQAGFATVVLADPPVELPELAFQTIRPRILRGPNPFAPKPAAPKPAAMVESRAAETRPAQPATPPKTAPAPTSRQSQPTIRPSAPPPPSVVQRPAAAAAASSTAPARTEPAARPEPPKTNGQPDRDRRQVLKPAAPAPPPANRPVRDRGNAVPVEEILEPPAPAPKPKMVPIRKAEPLAPAASAPAAAHDSPVLGLAAETKTSGSKIAMIAVVAAVLVGGAFLTFTGKSSGTAGTGSEENMSATSSGMVIGGGGWTTTWGADTPSNKGKQISIYRPSMTMPDYRFEFRGQIERKALGWIFRAQDPKNYYVMKLETIKPGANPVVALVKYAIVNGKETTHTQVMLPFNVSLDTVYQVRVDVKGEKFTTYVQGKLVDYWTDDRVKLGGAGFYTESGERSQIKNSQVSYVK